MIKSGLVNTKKARFEEGFPHQRDNTPKDVVVRPYVQKMDSITPEPVDKDAPKVTVPAPVMYDDIFGKRTTPDERLYILKQIQQGVKKIAATLGTKPALQPQPLPAPGVGNNITPPPPRDGTNPPPPPETPDGDSFPGITDVTGNSEINPADIPLPEGGSTLYTAELEAVDVVQPQMHYNTYAEEEHDISNWINDIQGPVVQNHGHQNDDITPANQGFRKTASEYSALSGSFHGIYSSAPSESSLKSEFEQFVKKVKDSEDAKLYARLEALKSDVADSISASSDDPILAERLRNILKENPIDIGMRQHLDNISKGHEDYQAISDLASTPSKTISQTESSETKHSRYDYQKMKPLSRTIRRVVSINGVGPRLAGNPSKTRSVKNYRSPSEYQKREEFQRAFARLKEIVNERKREEFQRAFARLKEIVNERKGSSTNSNMDVDSGKGSSTNSNMDVDSVRSASSVKSAPRINRQEVEIGSRRIGPQMVNRALKNPGTLANLAAKTAVENRKKGIRKRTARKR